MPEIKIKGQMEIYSWLFRKENAETMSQEVQVRKYKKWDKVFAAKRIYNLFFQITMAYTNNDNNNAGVNIYQKWNSSNQPEVLDSSNQ